MNKRLAWIPVLTLFTLVFGCASKPGGIYWRGDFEHGDLRQWNYWVNPQGLAVEENCVYAGKYSGRATINGSPEMLWLGHQHLNRTEFNYQPENGRVGEGKDLFFGWSFYLEQELTDTRHELGYWESAKKYQQMFRFNLHGQKFSFQETAQAEPFWVKDNFATVGVWHDVALHIHWSTNDQLGSVSVWLDGVYVSSQKFKTLFAENENMFTQIGLLRDQQAAVETILIDNVRAGENIDAVLSAFSKEKPVSCDI